MMAIKEIRRAERDLYRAADRLASALEARALERLIYYARRNPSKRCAFYSAMGTWSFSIGGELREDRVIDDLFSRVVGDIGWVAIPAPVALQVEGGTVKRLTDW